MNISVRREIEREIDTLSILGSTTRNEFESASAKQEVERTEKEFFELALSVSYKHLNKLMKSVEKDSTEYAAINKALSYFRSVLIERDKQSDNRRVSCIKSVLSYVSAFLEHNLRKGVSVNE